MSTLPSSPDLLAPSSPESTSESTELSKFPLPSFVEPRLYATVSAGHDPSEEQVYKFLDSVLGVGVLKPQPWHVLPFENKHAVPNVALKGSDKMLFVDCINREPAVRTFPLKKRMPLVQAYLNAGGASMCSPSRTNRLMVWLLTLSDSKFDSVRTNAEATIDMPIACFHIVYDAKGNIRLQARDDVSNDTTFSIHSRANAAAAQTVGAFLGLH